MKCYLSSLTKLYSFYLDAVDGRVLVDHPDLTGVGDHQSEAQQDQGHVDTQQRLLGAVPLLTEDIHRHSSQTEIEEP